MQRRLPLQDIVGFTAMGLQCSAEDVILFLHLLFSQVGQVHHTTWHCRGPHCKYNVMSWCASGCASHPQPQLLKSWQSVFLLLLVLLLLLLLQFDMLLESHQVQKVCAGAWHHVNVHLVIFVLLYTTLFMPCDMSYVSHDMPAVFVSVLTSCLLLLLCLLLLPMQIDTVGRSYTWCYTRYCAWRTVLCVLIAKH